MQNLINCSELFLNGMNIFLICYEYFSSNTWTFFTNYENKFINFHENCIKCHEGFFTRVNIFLNGMKKIRIAWEIYWLRSFREKIYIVSMGKNINVHVHFHFYNAHIFNHFPFWKSFKFPSLFFVYENFEGTRKEEMTL